MSNTLKTPEELERELMKDPTSPEAMTAEDVSANLLGIYTPIYENLVNDLSSNAMRRLLKKLVEFPLNEKEMAATSEKEAQAFVIGARLLEAKFLLMMDHLHKNAEQIRSQIEEK